MPALSNGTATQSPVRRAPFEGASSRSRYGDGSSNGASSRRTPSPGETDFYLHRSYALVERLRRAVAERDEF